MTKIVLITGGNKGLGYASAEALKALGYKVYIGSRNDVRGTSITKIRCSLCTVRCYK